MKEEGYSVIGKPIPRVEGIEKIKGEALYTTDIVLSGMLYGKILRSPYPHARIISIDTSKAERIKGVRAVITGRDIPDVRYALAMSMVPESADRYFLARDKVRFVGDEVAAVAAISEDIAEEALKHIHVEYEPLPAVFNIAEAIKADAPLIHDNFPGNLHTSILMDFGDVEQGFRESDYIREDRFSTHLVQHCFLEPHNSVANFDSSGRVTLWTSTQSPFLVKRLLSFVLKMPEGNIRVIKPHVGGGFGGKAGLYPLDLHCALLSKITGKPVRICYTREEEFSASCRRHPMEIAIKIGVKNDGAIVARKANIMLDGGAYNTHGPVVTFLAALWLSHVYRQPNIRFESQRFYTNKAPCTAMRGYTSPQSYLASEIQMDMVAEELGMDPIELRMKNGLKTGDTTVNGFYISSGGLHECLQKVEERSEWKKKYKKLPPLKGIGMSSTGLFSGNQLPLLGPQTASSTIFIKANPDGTAGIISGVSDIGQGSDTVLCQIAAEELGLGVEDIRITSVDTDHSPPDLITVSARCTFQAGNAVKSAAIDLKQKLFKAVAEKLEANIEDLEARDRRIYVKGSQEKGVSFIEAVSLCQLAHKGITIMGEGVWNPDPKQQAELNMVTGYGSFSPAYTFGAVVAEVEVDKDTGRVVVTNLCHSHDCGRVINLLGVEGQLEGACQMGLGYALFENIIVEGGKTLNPDFLDYKFPTAVDMPEMSGLFIESNDPGGPYGAKEGAEGLVGPIGPAILNAIYNATGIRFKELPLTPEKVLRELKKKKGEEQNETS
ncbi:MAG: molybdopterin-dependent oxidoreductase [Desulfobacterium sp.]|nr:molybdopterin-dependent oxidoreductase [Desulfobacterium sp.]MBU3950153.1 molybdopterin-dependent oxidoreductase [Pseudomonadota bacterium]MBU4037152.1 molybdopterin-dependent oxidoreductase [Pseudomonadota bacterium]